MPSLDQLRAQANASLDPQRKLALGQFMTPTAIARFMAGLFSNFSNFSNLDHEAPRLLDAGAGIGSLSAAFFDRWIDQAPAGASAELTAYELDPIMRGYLGDTLAHYQQRARQRGQALNTTLVAGDFIELAAERLLRGTGVGFSHAILNPPYQKLSAGSRHRDILRDVGIETVNLYTAFLALAVASLAEGGELVAIVPRSFCNGAYYRPFRAWMRKHAALTHLHLFESRSRAFKDDAVLQESLIVRWVRGASQGEVAVSWCQDASFAGLQRAVHPFGSIVSPEDPEGFIHIPLGETQDPPAAARLFVSTLEELGVAVSTGPVVDFRLTAHLRRDLDASAVPLLYPQHFASGGLRYPSPGKKPNALALNHETRRWLLPSGWYVVTKRFTTKEERRRVVAHVIDPAALPSEWLGLENHLNVFHHARAGINPDLAHGLALVLNSTILDQHFRRFSGHTQVNATDLRSMRYPPRDTLLALGRWARTRVTLSQDDIDRHLEGHR